MKKIKIILSVLLVAFVAGNSHLNAQRGNRGFRTDSVRISRSDTSFMNRTWMKRSPAFNRPGWYGYGQMRTFPGWRGFSYQSPGFRQPDYYWPGPGRRWINPVPPFPGKGGADSVYFDRSSRPMMRGADLWMERIPDLTDAQKSKLKELIDRNQAEMDKFRSETSETMNKMRINHREKLFEILNPEQKKWLESRMPASRIN